MSVQGWGVWDSNPRSSSCRRDGCKHSYFKKDYQALSPSSHTIPRISLTQEQLRSTIAEYCQGRPCDNNFRPALSVNTLHQSSMHCCTSSQTLAHSIVWSDLCTLALMRWKWWAAARAQQADLQLHPLALHLNMRPFPLTKHGEKRWPLLAALCLDA